MNNSGDLGVVERLTIKEAIYAKHSPYPLRKTPFNTYPAREHVIINEANLRVKLFVYIYSTRRG